MPHSSSIITAVTNATTSASTYLYGRVSPALTERFSVPTTPPSSASPVELAPILDICDSDNRPPSPDSPKLKKLSDGVYGHHLERFHQPTLPPPYLEPSPQFTVEPTSNLFSPNLFKVLKQTFTLPPPQIPTSTSTLVQIPIPRRRSSTTQKSRMILSPSPSTTTTASISSMDPMSPTMAAASASAAAAADHRNPGSHLAKSLLKSISSNKRLLQDEEVITYHHSTTTTATTNRATAPLNHNKKQPSNNNVDQSMFLTKNAHIKRPRNAWIHFRCHYGQALKAQDPTLRAEEISKRASRRWGKLSEIEKRPWHGLAEQEKLAHREAFPEYRYCPRRATSSSVSPPSPPAAAVNNRVRSATASEINPLHMHDVYNIPASIVQRPQKRVKRNSK